MNLLYSKMIHDKLAELLLADDHTVIVRYDGKVIDESYGKTYLNIENIYDMYLQFCVNIYITEQERQKELKELYDMARSLGWKDIS